MMSLINANIVDDFTIVWAIAWKDILDASKNKNTRTNLILLLGLVVFFYWASTPRPFDKRIDVVVFDQGNAGLEEERVELADGYSFAFYQANSREEMERMMAYKQLGVILPADFMGQLASESEPSLTGYIFWVHRDDVVDLEVKYSAKFSEYFGQPVHLQIGDNFVIPRPDMETSTVQFNILFATLWLALSLVPQLMLEEKRTKTMSALLVSPASPGQVVAGKAMAGLFYVTLGGGLFFALNWAYITNWGLALLAFLCCALFGIGLSLVLGGLVRSSQHVAIWMAPIVLLLLVPALFAQEPNLAPGLRSLFAWVPTTALVEIFQMAISSEVPPSLLLMNLTIVAVSTILVYAIVVWQVRQMDR